MRAETKTKKPIPLLFAADEGSATIYAYPLAGSGQGPLWSVSGAPLKYPEGMWVDGSLNLYVADESGFVFEYDAPSAAGPPGAPSFVYDDPNEYPDEVAACGDYVYGSNALGSNSHESLTVWKKGVAAPLRVATSPHYADAGTGYGVTCDTTGPGHVYFGYDVADNGPAAIDLWSADGSGSPTTLPMAPLYLEGLARNKAGLFVLGDEYANPNPAIQFYKATSQSPTEQISKSWVGDPLGFAYESSDSALWVADAYYKTLTRIKPKTGAVLDTVVKPGFQNLTGVAVSPPDHP